MKKFFIIFASMFFMFACTQEEDNLLPANDKAVVETSELTTAEAQIRFAKLLSKAASSSVEVRKFLKNEATKQFDNDYDVFYPMVKNKIVTDGKSFRDILLSYCNDPKELIEIEQSQLLLNILIPDMTLFWDFNAEKWDANNQEIVVMCRDDESDTMYENGENIGQMEKGDIPGFPCLVVKNNERLRVKSANTRSGEATYEFTSDAFDGSKRVEKAVTRHSDSDIIWETPENLDAYIPSSKLPDFVIAAWDELKSTPNSEVMQRDYIYYGINKTNKPGKLNRNIRERLFRFRIDSKTFGDISNENKDPKLGFTAEKHRASTEEIMEKIWKDGHFEFAFKIYIGSSDVSKAMTHDLKFNVEGKEAFSIDKIHLRHKNSTMFRQSKNFYTVENKNISSKWIYPELLAKKSADDKIFLLPWDLYYESTLINMFIYEDDESLTIKDTKTIQNRFETHSDFSATNKDTKVGGGFSHTQTTTSEVTIERQQASDYLGNLAFLYDSPVIRAENKSAGTYALFNVSNGVVTATLLPTNHYY